MPTAPLLPTARLKAAQAGRWALVFGVGVGVEVVEGAPVLEDHDGAPAEEGLGVEEAELGLIGRAR